MSEIWSCKIGETDRPLPPGADGPMRRAVERAYKEITGEDSAFLFSGWGAELTEPERAALEDRLPVQPDPTSPLDLAALKALCDAATPGPWTEPEECTDPGDEGWWILGGGVPGSMEEHAIAVTLPHTSCNAEADARFIAAAREAVPTLLAALAEAQRERDEVEARAAELLRQLRGTLAALATARADVESLGHWHCPNCGGGEATDVDDDGAMCATCGHQIEWSEPDVLSRAKAYAAKLREAKNRAFEERDAARADAERLREVFDAAAVYIRTPSLDLSRPHPAPREAHALIEAVHAYEDVAAVDTYETQEGTDATS